jgi:hypothetical protein
MNTNDVTISLIIYKGEAGRGGVVVVVGHDGVGCCASIVRRRWWCIGRCWSPTIVVLRVVVVHCLLWPCIVHRCCASPTIVVHPSPPPSYIMRRLLWSCIMCRGCALSTVVMCCPLLPCVICCCKVPVRVEPGTTPGIDLFRHHLTRPTTARSSTPQDRPRATIPHGDRLLSPLFTFFIDS